MPTETSLAVLIGEAYASLRKSQELTPAQAEACRSPRLTREQRCSLLAGLALRPSLTDHERETASSIAQLEPTVAQLLGRSDLIPAGLADPVGVSDSWKTAFSAVLGGHRIGSSCLAALVRDIVSGGEHLRVAAALLMCICVKGMLPEDLADLTRTMADSGRRFDYRDDAALRGVRLVRRYPTGALSEKVALILPSLIACARTKASVASPFLVARSLGYTGGTWDKLNAIDGFHFPAPGDESIAALVKCGVAMTVTKGDANPSDRILYQLRSATGTVESPPLIVSSIASKHLCFPVHRLLMDVRYGEGAFLATKPEAGWVGDELERVLCAQNVPTFYTLTDTSEPTGVAIGNSLEVAEAIAVMGGPPNALWDERALAFQRLIAVDFFAKLMAAEFSVMNAREWAAFATRMFEGREVLRSFGTLLRAHEVPEKVIEELVSDPLKAVHLGGEPTNVHSEQGGTLRRIDQRKLGGIVNRALGAGGNEFAGEFDARAGVILTARLGDRVPTGGALCKVFASRVVDQEVLEGLRSCFVVS